MRPLLARVLPTILLFSGCSTTTYTSGPAVATRASLAPPGLRSAPTQPDRGHVVIDVVGASASVVEVGAQGSSRSVCAATPCSEDVAPGTHRYRLVPPPERTMKLDPSDDVVSKDGTYSAPVDVDVSLVAGQTHRVRSNLGEAQVHRTVPVGRIVAIAIMVAGVAVAIWGAANASSAPSGSPDQEIGQGLQDIGIGTFTIGAAVLSGNLRDNSEVTTHAGASVQSVC